MVIFIVLGIAADDVFVLFDSWKQSEHIVEYEGNLRKRMAYAWRRSSHAMFITSSTTCLAFLSTSMSKIVPIKSFGYYSAIIIPMNYFLIIFMLPPMLIFYEKYCSRMCCKKPKAERKQKYSYDGSIEPAS